MAGLTGGAGPGFTTGAGGATGCGAGASGVSQLCSQSGTPAVGTAAVISTFGFSAGFQPTYFMTRYDDMLPAFGKTRSDDTVMLAFTLLNRRFDYHGFTLTASAQADYNDLNKKATPRGAFLVSEVRLRALGTPFYQ